MIKAIETILHDLEDSNEIQKKARELGYSGMNNNFGRSFLELKEGLAFPVIFYTRPHSDNGTEVIETIRNSGNRNVYGLYRVN